MKVKNGKMSQNEIENFARILKIWSEKENSYFLREFIDSFGMSEMQFYGRIWKAQALVEDFDYEEIKQNLRKNRYSRNYRKLVGSKGSSAKIFKINAHQT